MSGLKWVVLYVVLISVTFGIFYYVMFNNPQQVHDILLTEDGFIPNISEISLGDVVRFSTNREKDFWPASNDHPIHSAYPEFDPRHPLKTDEAWEFQFTKRGSWKYHDHLYSFSTGTINVR